MVSGEGRDLYFSEAYSDSRGAYWMIDEEPSGSVASSWEDASFYSGLFPAGAVIGAGRLYVCFNYFNGTGSMQRASVTLMAGSEGAWTTLVEDQTWWLDSTNTVERSCYRTDIGEIRFEEEGGQGRLWLDIKFDMYTTATRLYWDGHLNSSMIRLPSISTPE
jgi:hypothetical protein